MGDTYSKELPGLDSPATRGFAITPHDTNELSSISRAVYVGGTGDVVAILQGDSAAVTFSAVPVGTVLPIRVKTLKSTGTTATNLIALF